MPEEDEEILGDRLDLRGLGDLNMGGLGDTGNSGDLEGFSSIVGESEGDMASTGSRGGGCFEISDFGRGLGDSSTISSVSSAPGSGLWTGAGGGCAEDLETSSTDSCVGAGSKGSVSVGVVGVRRGNTPDIEPGGEIRGGAGGCALIGEIGRVVGGVLSSTPPLPDASAKSCFCVTSELAGKKGRTGGV